MSADSHSATVTDQHIGAYGRFLAELDRLGKRHRQANGSQAKHNAQCPAHDDSVESLVVTDAGGKVLLHCHGGCSFDDVLAAVGWTRGDAWDNGAGETYSYTDGRIVRRFHQGNEKRFFQKGARKDRSVLFHLAGVKAAVADGVGVWLVEGEKDVRTLESLPVVATTAPQGALSFHKVDASPLYGGHVKAIVDRDAGGQKWALQVRDKLAGQAKSLEFVQAKVGNDVSDHIAAGFSLADLEPVNVEEEREPVQPVQPVKPVQGEGGTQAADTPEVRGPLGPVGQLGPVTGRGVPAKAAGASDALDNVRAWLARYICTVTPSDLDLLTLWAAHTHLVMETYTTPRLLIDSPCPDSGKTTCLEHLQRLSKRSVTMAAITSPALLTRMLDAEMRTLLIDEADRSLDENKDGIKDLLAVLNSGYKRGATRPVLVPTKNAQWEVKEMPTFAPVAMAGNNPRLPDDTQSRCIRVLLLPDLHGRVEESDWEMIEAEALRLHDQLVLWAESVREKVQTERPTLPDGIAGRLREKWSPLKRVAHQAGGRWPAAVDQMALEDKEQGVRDREDGMVREKPALILLRHLYDVWGAGEEFIPTSELVARLVDLFPAVWGPSSPYGRALTVQRFGRMLATSYKINSGRETNFGRRGYFRSAFDHIWSLTLIAGSTDTPPLKPAQAAQAAQPAQERKATDIPGERSWPDAS